MAPCLRRRMAKSSSSTTSTARTAGSSGCWAWRRPAHLHRSANLPTATESASATDAGAGNAFRQEVGHVVAARGSVLDVQFAGDLPAIREALAVDWDAGAPLIAEVQQHLDPRRVRI